MWQINCPYHGMVNFDGSRRLWVYEHPSHGTSFILEFTCPVGDSVVRVHISEYTALFYSRHHNLDIKEWKGKLPPICDDALNLEKEVDNIIEKLT